MADDVASGALFELLKGKRDQLLRAWGTRINSLVASASLPHAELIDHMPAFVDELIQALYPGAVPLPPAGAGAEQHGEQRLSLGFDVAEVVREYGMLHECILEIAAEAGLHIDRRDQLLLVKWLNAGIANAVSQYVKERDLELQRQSSEHLGFIAHELRNPLGSAKLAFERLRRKELAESRTVDMLDRGLRRTSEMIDSVLSQASLKMGVAPRLAPVALRPFLQEIEADAGAEAVNKGIEVKVSAPEDLIIEADFRLLRSAVSNLLHNALKFSHEQSTVVVSAGHADGRVTIACDGNVSLERAIARHIELPADPNDCIALLQKKPVAIVFRASPEHPQPGTTAVGDFEQDRAVPRLGIARFDYDHVRAEFHLAFAVHGRLRDVGDDRVRRVLRIYRELRLRHDPLVRSGGSESLRAQYIGALDDVYFFDGGCERQRRYCERDGGSHQVRLSWPHSRPSHRNL